MLARKPVPVIEDYDPLICEVCGEDLLEEGEGILGVAFRRGTPSDHRRIRGVYWACKGRCDQEAQDIHYSEGYSTGWRSIADLSIPAEFLNWTMAIMNRIMEGNVEQEAFEKIKLFILIMSQVVMRETTPEERERLQDLNMMQGF